MGKKNSLSSILEKKQKSIKTLPGNTKKKILMWSDSCLATTGFGIVAKHILAALYSTGKYEINQLAINYFGDFYDREKIPYVIVPARFKDPRDPYGNDMLIDSLLKGSYDYLLIVNDTYVTNGIVPRLLEARSQLVQQGKPAFKIVYYYPVDCRLWPNTSGMIKAADVAVAYNFYGRAHTEIDLGLTPHEVIYHGADIETFFPAEVDAVQRFRESVLLTPDPETFIWINVNRNSPRKDIAKTILAFSEFKKKVPNSKLYLHTKVIDGPNGVIQIDLRVPCGDLGLEPVKDVIFPQDFNPAEGVSGATLNMLINSANAMITTTSGEGWGLCVGNAMAAGVPVLVPDNTSFPEIVGPNEEAGYMYPCKEKVYIDLQGFRPIGQLEDIVSAMMRVYNDVKEGKTESRIQNALQFTHNYSWHRIGQLWIDLFTRLEAEETVSSSPLCVGAEEI